MSEHSRDCVSHFQQPCDCNKNFPQRIWIKESDADYLRMQNLGIEHEWVHLSEANALAEEREARARREGIKECILRLRELQDEYRHQRKWNSSATTTFAPVELSDWLLVNVLNTQLEAAKGALGKIAAIAPGGVYADECPLIARAALAKLEGK